MPNHFIHWILFIVSIAGALALDLRLHFKQKKQNVRQALYWSCFWIGLALGYNLWIYFSLGKSSALDFLAAYLVEKSLSIDNLFVFLMIFQAFSIPHSDRHKVLFWGIIGAFILRALFIVGGISLVIYFHWILYLFGVMLIYSGFKLITQVKEDMNSQNNPIIRWCKAWIPVTHETHTHHFWIKINDTWHATPLFLALVAIESSDVIFAIDSIPAVLGITTDPLIVFTSNIFAILGLRALYFALEGSFQYFYYLHYALSGVLIFIGIKMLIADFIPISTAVSLAVIGSMISASIIASLSPSGRPGP
jgi:tellurite resistance protein TerC